MANIGKVPAALRESVRAAVGDDGKISRAEVRDGLWKTVGDELGKLSTEREVDEAVESYKAFFSQQTYTDSGKYVSNAWKKLLSTFDLDASPVKTELFQKIDMLAAAARQQISDAASAQQALSRFDAKLAAPSAAPAQTGQALGADFELGNTKREVRAALSDNGTIDFTELRDIANAVTADLSDAPTLADLDARLQAVKDLLTGVGYADGSERLTARLTVLLRETPVNERTALYREIDGMLAGVRYLLTNKAKASEAVGKLDQE